MARKTAQHVETIPIGPLGIIGMPGCEKLTDKIDAYLVEWRKTQAEEHQNTIAFYGYARDTFKIKVDLPRFGTGEAKATLKESVRGYDIYIIADVFNYSITYNIYGLTVPMSPDDHFADIKRVISAISGKAKRITVIMPMLYEGRQHKRNSRESLDCALALQELIHLGVESIITFDAERNALVYSETASALYAGKTGSVSLLAKETAQLTASKDVVYAGSGGRITLGVDSEGKTVNESNLVFAGTDKKKHSHESRTSLS